MSKFKRLLSLFLSVMMIVTTIMSTGVIAHASNSVEPFSLLPLEEVKAYLVLNDYSEEEIKAMPLEKVLSLMQDSNGNYIEIPEKAEVVWAHFKDNEGNVIRDEYHVLAREETVDLTEFEYTTGYSMELIVGSGNQLDPNNVRYIVRVYLTNSVREELGFDIYYESENGARNKVLPIGHKTMGMVVMDIPETANVFTVPEHIEGTEYYLGISSIADEHPYMKVDVYTLSEFINYLSTGTGTPLTDQMLNLDMSKKGAGYKTVLDTTEDPLVAMEHNIYALVYSDPKTGYMYSYNLQAVYVAPKILSYDANVFTYENKEMNNVVSFKTSLADPDKAVEQLCLMLNEGYSSNTDYYITLNVESLISGTTNEHIIKAVHGLYTSIDDVTDVNDIKDQLFPIDKNVMPYGFVTSYSDEGKGVFNDFTIFFDDGNVSQIEVVILEYSEELFTNKMLAYTDAPIVGAKDPWFRVDGVKGSTNSLNLDTYVVENGKTINMDTMYGYGYQTVFINDKDVDLSQLKPTFWLGDADRVETYVGSKQESGVSVQDFSKGPIQYSTIIDDNVKNYNVTFVKKENGPKLFVNGPSTRAVFLDEYFEYKHDILIANVGDQPLTDLKVTLDAKNVKLDDYWTVGGTNNDTLAAFTTTEDTSDYGELANIAKIRLLPDGDGEVEGTLTISAKDQEDVVINLTGRAANPKIITNKLDDAVKYVPYSYVVSTDNMNDWNSVTFSIESGNLPEGLDLYPTTGEIYGVPQETGTFKIRVKATYGREDYFEPSYADLTLTVKENTDENVYLASDINKGYSIKQPIGTQTGDYSFELNEIADTVFTSNGEYGEFVGLWLNGELLEPGVDYDSESGSTKITIKSQTFENRADKDGTNTIAMEFRKDTNGDGIGDSGAEMNRTAQNFTVKTETKVDKVIAKIAALPTKITLNDKFAVQDARNAYNALSSSDKKKVINYSKLVAAEATIAQIEEDTKNQAAANKVIKLINNLPSYITLESKDMVASARSAYNSLTAKQKKLVVNYDRLQRAESAIKRLEDIQRDKEAANIVVELINSLPNHITANSKNDINQARNAYNLLTYEQKKYVTNYDLLNNAEIQLNKILSDDEKSQFVILVGILTDEVGKPLSDYTVEICSDKMIAKTDENGSFRFNNVEFGNHTITVKDHKGTLLAQKTFDLVLGTPLSINDNEIIAENGSVFTLSIQLDGDKLALANIESGDTSPEIDLADPDDSSIFIGDSDKNIDFIETGDVVNLEIWWVLFIISLLGYIFFIGRFKRNEKINVDND